MRPSNTLARELGDPVALIDAAIAVNEAPTLGEAFQILSEAGLGLLGALRIGVTVWDERGEHGRIVAGAGEARADVGKTITGSDAIQAMLLTREVNVGRLTSFPPEVEASLSGLGTIVAVPLLADSSRTIFHAGWESELDGDELERATTLLKTLTRLTSLA